MSLAVRVSLVFLVIAAALAGAALFNAHEVNARRHQALTNGYGYSVGLPGA